MWCFVPGRFRAYFLIQESVGWTLETLKLLPAQTLMRMATSVMNLSNTWLSNKLDHLDLRLTLPVLQESRFSSSVGRTR